MKPVQIVDDFISMKNIENKRLKIDLVIVNKEFVQINIVHWDNKWVQCAGGGSNNYFQTYSFQNDEKELFEIAITNEFIELYNLESHAFHRNDKYETQMLLTRGK